MQTDLRTIYAAAGLLRYYFDDTVPCDLFRGQSQTEAKQRLPILYPNPGFTRSDGKKRAPDVLIVEEGGKLIVKGCRTTRGEHRGISTFDRKNPKLKGFAWHKLPKSIRIPEALAITQDTDLADSANHFTIAPKDDMPLALFQVWLNALATHMTEDK